MLYIQNNVVLIELLIATCILCYRDWSFCVQNNCLFVLLVLHILRPPGEESIVLCI